MADARVFQEQTEVAVGGQTTDAHLFQEQAEVGITAPSSARVFQEILEVAQENGGPQFVLAVGIGSAEQFGAVVVVQGDPAGLFPTAIATGESVGTPALVYDQFVEPDPIASEEDVNPIGIEGFLGPTGIPSQEAVGSAKLLSPYIYPVGIPGADQPGNPSVSGVSVGKKKTIRLNNRGIASAEAVGTPTLTNKRVTPDAIASAEAVGTPNLIVPQIVTLTGITSAEAVGTPSIARPDTIIPDPIGSAETFGTPAIVRAGTIEPTGIASSEAFGTPELVTLEQTVLPDAITSAEIFGTPTIIRLATHVIAPTAIGTGQAFGTPTIVGAPNAPIQPSSIVSRERFGLPRITVGIPQGPVSQPPGRIANRLYDPETGVAFAFAINHSDEEPRAFERTYEAGAPTTVGLVRHQSGADLMRLVFRGVIFDPMQKTAMDALFEHCDEHTLIYEDYSGEAYEVIITTWDCRPERARNPLTRGLLMWRYTTELAILRVLHGPVMVGGQPAPVPPDIVIDAPPVSLQPVGIASREAAGSLVVAGGDLVMVPSAVRSVGGVSSPVVIGGTAPGGGGPGSGGGSSIPAPYPSLLRASGTVIVDSNDYVMSRMTGGSIHTLPGFVPPQDFLHQIKARGGSWLRIVCRWDVHEPSQGVWSSEMKTQIDTMLTRCRIAGLYVMFELHLNTGNLPSWMGSSGNETAKYATHGEFITKAFAARYASNPIVMGWGLNEIPLDDDTIRNGNNAIPYLEGLQRTMISWFRTHAPHWIGFVTLGYSNQTPYPDAPRTPASVTAWDSVGKNVGIDLHDYGEGVNSSDPSHDGRQPNGMIYPTWQPGGYMYWGGVPYVDTATHRSQMAAYYADYVTFCNAAQIPLVVGEIGWDVNNGSGKAAYWAAKRAILSSVKPAMVGWWMLAQSPLSQDPYGSTPNNVWDPDAEAFLRAR